MDRIDRSVLLQLAEWQRVSLPCALVTIVKTWGTAPRPAGAMLAVAADGRFAGSVSGGCIEDDLITELIQSRPAQPTRRSFGVSAEQAARHGLPCGGRLEVMIESVGQGDWTQRLLELLARRQPVTRQLSLADGAVTLLPQLAVETITLTGAHLLVPMEPLWRMVIIGAGHLSRLTATFARELGYDVTICEPRKQYREALAIDGVTVSATMPDDLLAEMQPDGSTIVLALTHDPKFDDLALLEALGSDAFYVGALGSSRTSASRRKRLQEHFDVSEDLLARLHGPVGIDLQSRRAPEIALAILTEITALRNGVELSARPSTTAAVLEQL